MKKIKKLELKRETIGVIKLDKWGGRVNGGASDSHCQACGRDTSDCTTPIDGCGATEGCGGTATPSHNGCTPTLNSLCRPQ